jgi:hypothetical protein
LIIELLANDIQKKSAEAVRFNETYSENTDNSDHYYEMPGEPNSVNFSLVQCVAKEEQIDLSGQITVIEFQTEDKQTLHTFRCKEAALHIETDKLTPTFSLDLRNARVIESGQTRMWHTIENLNLPPSVKAIAQQFQTEEGSVNYEKLVSGLSEVPGFKPSPELAGLHSGLRRKIQKTRVEIKSEIHSRLVFGIGCVAMILIGIGLGIIKRGGHLLSAFGASCIPAAVLIICIMSGKQLTENLSAQTISGVLVMWAGLIFLFLLTVAIYNYLLKN